MMATLAYCMILPLRWDRLDRLGALALCFPLHLLVIIRLSVAHRPGIMWSIGAARNSASIRPGSILAFFG
jgi:hypothetical protein